MRKVLVRINMLLFLLILMHSSLSFGQVTSEQKSKKVKLIDWKHNPCDNTYNPYMLVNRITSINIRDGVTFLTVNFSDNCCAEFRPEVQFKNDTLFLQPYKEFPKYCFCDCCFSIEYKIEGLPEKQYEICFKGKKVQLSGDHYRVVKPSSELYKGDTINRLNRYGFKEGLWMTFYDDGKVKMLEKYPDKEIYEERYAQLTKWFFPSGRLQQLINQDTAELWFEDGAMKLLQLNYKIGDTTYCKRLFLYDNRQLRERSLERSYPTVFKSDFDASYETNGTMNEKIYEESFFENGKPKSRFGKDTSREWHESGNIASVKSKSEKVEYDKDGFVIEREFHWKTKGPASLGDLNHSLYADIDRNERVLRIHYVRDEASQDRVGPNAHYYWAWDAYGKLIEAPAKWNEAVPWIKFDQLVIRK